VDSTPALVPVASEVDAGECNREAAAVLPPAGAAIPLETAAAPTAVSHPTAVAVSAVAGVAASSSVDAEVKDEEESVVEVAMEHHFLRVVFGPGSLGLDLSECGLGRLLPVPHADGGARSTAKAIHGFWDPAGDKGFIKDLFTDAAATGLDKGSGVGSGGGGAVTSGGWSGSDKRRWRDMVVVCVASVGPNGQASACGVEAGDVVVEVIDGPCKRASLTSLV
jgi:hypothetical protein